MADINLSQCCEKALGLGGSAEQRRKEKGQISQLEFPFVFTSKASQCCLVRGPHKEVHIFVMFLTCALNLSHSHMYINYTAVWGFWQGLLPSVVCVVSEHEPLSAC